MTSPKNGSLPTGTALILGLDQERRGTGATRGIQGMNMRRIRGE